MTIQHFDWNIHCSLKKRKVLLNIQSLSTFAPKLLFDETIKLPA